MASAFLLRLILVASACSASTGHVRHVLTSQASSLQTESNLAVCNAVRNLARLLLAFNSNFGLRAPGHRDDLTRCSRFIMQTGAPAVDGVRDLGEDYDIDEVVRNLDDATCKLRELKAQWKNLSHQTDENTKLLERDAELRALVKACPLGDPADTWKVRSRQSGDSVVRSHMNTARALLEVEVARLEWEIGCLEEQTGNEHQLGPALIKMATAKDRLSDLDGCHKHLQRAFAVTNSTALLVKALQSVQFQTLDSADFMTGADLSAGSQGQELMQGIKQAFSEAGYTKSAILQATKAESMFELYYEKNYDELDYEMILQSGQVNVNLAYLIRMFLLHRVLPLSAMSKLFGPPALKLLLTLQVISVVNVSGVQLLSPSEALEAVQGGPDGYRSLHCFSNVAMWPIEDDLVIATDYVSAASVDGLDPVMYIAADSYALASGAPQDPPVARLLDVCSGSGIQGIVGMRYYAETCTFVDLNPRAIRFTTFNVALNGFANRSLGVYQGSVFEALPGSVEPFDAILSNPPFIPNPGGVSTLASAMFGDGGATGEDVMESLVAGAHRMLAPGGRLSTISVAPNVEEMPERVEKWFSSKLSGPASCKARIFTGQPESREAWSADSRSSLVERVRLAQALKSMGIRTLSRVIMILQVGGSHMNVSLAGEPREKLWLDHEFLREAVRSALL